jgi:4-hydroxybenzoate polyprenyltransferase
LLHVAVVFAQECGVRLKEFDRSSVLLLTGMFWSMSLAWEISRKIRSREEENAYVTYSQIFGRRRSVLVAGLCQTATLTIGIYFYVTFSLSITFLLIITAGYAAMLGAYARFIIAPSVMTSKLKPWAELFLLSVCLAACTQINL